MSVELTPETTPEYLLDRGILTPDSSPRVEELGGGVSNHVLRVTWDSNCLVLKQPLPNLAVDDDWPADVARVHNEAAATRAYAAVIAEAGLEGVRVPTIEFEDHGHHVIGLECAPPTAVMWKESLLAGEVDAAVAEVIGRVLGAVHRETAGDAVVRSAFASKRPFKQLRIDPYHYTTADRHPDVAEAIREEARRVLAVDETLVHGDYSPKNVLLTETSETRVAWILDFEVAHWGDPAFDIGFMLNHLFIKSVYNAEHAPAYEAAARAFYDAYCEEVPWDVEQEAVAELGVLMLARMDGKSPVEYVEGGPVAETLRRIAKRLIRREARTLDGVVRIAREERGRNVSD